MRRKVGAFGEVSDKDHSLGSQGADSDSEASMQGFSQTVSLA